jgi:hypothetical protein
MLETAKPYCPECDTLDQDALDRRDFIRVVGGGAVSLAALSSLPAAPRVLGDEKAQATAKAEKPAEALIKELYASLTSEQKPNLVYPWDHVQGGQRTPTRMRMYNAPIFNRHTIGTAYTKPQQELVKRILRSICSDEDGYRQISRNGTFDGSKTFEGCGAYIFGEPGEQSKYAWVFTGHHLTVRCDGNSQEGAAFGGPMYYGHSPNGYNERNCFYYQTKGVLSVYEALSEGQRKKAVVRGTPGEGEGSVRLRGTAAQHPGISFGELNKDQQALVEKVMRDVLSPYRKEDADEVMEIIKATGGMAKIHLAFYEDREMNDNQRWHFWRLEGPGFVWNYRVLPHVHTYVNISSKV